MCLSIGSSNERRFFSSNNAIAIAVNCLLTEAIRNIESGVILIPCSRLAMPYPALCMYWLSLITPTAHPGLLFVLVSLKIASTFEEKLSTSDA